MDLYFWFVRSDAVLTQRHERSDLVGDHMNKLFIFIGMTVLGSIGWWLGAKVGFMTAFGLSGIGSILGVYVGWRINRDYFE